MNQQSDEILAIGKIIEVNGSRIIIELDSSIDELSKTYEGNIYSIGQFGSILKIYFGRRIIYAHVFRLRMKDVYDNENPKTIDFSSLDRIIEANLFGEGERNKDKFVFERGVSTYPLPQQKVYLTTQDELAYIFEKDNQSQIAIGEHVGMAGISAYIDFNELLNKHSAILGSTGSGKSGTVAAIIHSILDYGQESNNNRRTANLWNPNIFILDPHNEYSSAFPEGKYEKLSIEQQNLKLPYWLFSLQETIELLIGKTEFVATSQSNIVKKALLAARKGSAEDKEITVDSPIPYNLETFKQHINSDKPKQESKQEAHLKILDKLEILRNDSRYNFMMENWKSDNNNSCGIIKNIISGNKCLKIIDLSGIPNEVAGIVSSVIARILFSIKIWQTPEERASSPILLVCEEAHRYIPAKGEAQYESAQEAVKRIAKEGRKYGIGLMLVSQRPSEVEATVLSQCNSWIVLRTTNETDASYIRSMIPDSLSTMTQILSTLRRREALVIGQAITVPARILIKELPKDQLPSSGDIDFCKGWKNSLLNQEDIKTICNRWIYQKMDNK